MARGRFGVFGVSYCGPGEEAGRRGPDGAFPVTEFQAPTVGVGIRPSKMTGRGKNGLNLREAAQNPVTSWCQSRIGCDKQLCLHYETHRIHDFGLKSCSSWIHSSHTAPRNLANGWSNNPLALWTNLVRVFRSGSV